MNGAQYDRDNAIRHITTDEYALIAVCGRLFPPFHRTNPADLTDPRFCKQCLAKHIKEKAHE